MLENRYLYAADGLWSIHRGDSLHVMASLAADRFATVITDPPYGLSFMGAAWDHGVPGAPYWREALRVTKPGGMLYAFGGTRTFHRLAVAIEDAGWEIRDCLMWLYGSGFPKSHNISVGIDKAAGADRGKVDRIRADGKATGKVLTGFGGFDQEVDKMAGPPVTDAAKLWDGWGTALKPAWEPIIVAMKPTDGTYAENAILHGVAGIHIEGARIGDGSDRSAGGATGMRVSADDGYGGAWADASEGRERPTGGRFPANLILDPEAGESLDEQSPGASRFFYCAKANKDDRGPGNDHPTVKPHDLMRYLCRLSRMPGDGGEILDPFGGSMSTLKAAVAEGRRCVGIDLNTKYCEIGCNRLEKLSA